MRRFDRGDYSFRPGEALGSYILHVDIDEPGRPPAQRFEINHHAYRLRQSLCYIKGGITCISCHDPHQPLKKDPRLANVVSVCLGCHQRHTESNDCVKCHMPARRAQDVVHVVMTDHRIQRRPPPGDPAAPLAEHEPHIDDVQFLDRAEVPEGPLGEVYRAVTILRAIPRNDAATSFLSRHLKATPSIVPRLDLVAAQLQQRHFQVALDLIGALGDAAIRDPRLRDWRGTAEVGVGSTAGGLADLRAAMEADPEIPEYQFNFAAILHRSGRDAEALPPLTRAIDLRPNFTAAWIMRAETFTALVSLSKASSGDFGGNGFGMNARLSTILPSEGSRAWFGSRWRCADGESAKTRVNDRGARRTRAVPGGGGGLHWATLAEELMDGAIPTRCCDIVMKGGITSGVVYPKAIAELAEEFRFKNVGGTSAGAIAAALAAAAEYARVSGKGAGFARLEQLPDFLAGKTEGEPNLLNLFPPAKPARRLFAVITAFLGDGSSGEKLVAAFGALLLVTPLLTILSFAPAVLLPAVLRDQLGSLGAPALAVLLVVELVLIAAGIGLMIAGNAVRALAFTLPRNRFGFSTGMAPEDRRLPGVSEWLHDEIQKTAGLDPNDPPLTFGDLWLAGEGVTDREGELRKRENDPGLRAINLQMITTALSHGHPYRLPFENRRFGFRPSELRQYFPAAVVNYLVDKAREGDEAFTGRNDPDLHALPEPWDLPIVVAARMSLSFPILFAMVPLHAFDYTLEVNSTAATQPEHCWFIDGGLSSNFPASLFDCPFPRWPTFGINLEEFHPDHPKDPANEENNVWMMERSGSGTSDRWRRFPERGPGAIGGYIGAVLDAIRNWHDNTQMAVPGFRDRIAHVKLSADEGGLNLKMDPAKVAALSERGKWAAVRLRERFGASGATRTGLNWNTHRWVRFRTSMMLLQKMLRQTAEAFSESDPVYPSYHDLVNRTADKEPVTGSWWPRTPPAYRDSTMVLEQFASAFSSSAPDFEEKSPQPGPELRISPKL